MSGEHPISVPTPTPSPRAVRAARARRGLPASREGLLVRWTHLSRDGEWVVPPRFRAAAFMGGMTLDLTRARLAAPAAHIELLAMAGVVTVRVPARFRLDCDADWVVGGAAALAAAARLAEPGAPVLRITGTVIVGAIRVEIVDR